MAEFQGKHMDEVENAVKEALKPMPSDTRPRIFPVTEALAEKAAAAEKPWEPQRTVVTHLEDIEKLGNATLDRVNRQDQSLSQILHSINDRMGLILDRIGVLENLIGVK